MLAQGPFADPSGHGGTLTGTQAPSAAAGQKSSHAVKMRGLKPSRVDPCLISLDLAASPPAPLGYRQIFIHNGGSDPFFALLRRSTRPNFPRLTAGSTANHTDRATLGRVSHWLDPSLASVWSGRRGGRKTLHVDARCCTSDGPRGESRDGSSCWVVDPGILDFLGPLLGYGSLPPHHQPHGNNSGRSLQVGRLERPDDGRAAHPATCLVLRR